MIVKRTYTKTYEANGYRIRDLVVGWYFLGFILLYQTNEEQWRKALLIDRETREQVFGMDTYFCVYCDADVTKDPTIDHLIPQIDGGLSLLDNLVTACRSCNSKKNGKTPEEARMTPMYGRFAFPELPKAGDPLRGNDLVIRTHKTTSRS